jgi:PTS system nitrogen regulatory IIA component
LDVPETTLKRWIKQRSLPAHFAAGQYHFHPSELLEWATANDIKVCLQLFEGPGVESESTPTLAAALEAGGIVHGIQAPGKEQALRSLIEVLPLPAGCDRELLLQLFLSREASSSTAVGDGIAIPHVRNPVVLNVARATVSLCFLDRPIEFAARDGKPVHTFFSLICPTARCHLQLLARLSFALHDAKFKEVVLRRGTREEILQEAHRLSEEG